MTFITVRQGDEEQLKMLEGLMLDYVSETDDHQNIKTTKEIIPKITRSMIDKLSEDRILEIVTEDGYPIGFFYAKIDRKTDRGLVRDGWGYIMEFYVAKAYRRREIGRQMVDLCEKFFKDRGAKDIWLTADGVTGIPFWISVGYTDSGELSPENGQKILVKELNN